VCTLGEEKRKQSCITSAQLPVFEIYSGCALLRGSLGETPFDTKHTKKGINRSHKRQTASPLITVREEILPCEPELPACCVR